MLGSLVRAQYRPLRKAPHTLGFRCQTGQANPVDALAWDDASRDLRTAQSRRCTDATGSGLVATDFSSVNSAVIRFRANAPPDAGGPKPGSTTKDLNAKPGSTPTSA